MTQSASAERPPLYPYELAIFNCILLLLAVGAIFQDSDLDLRPKITGIVALTLVAGLLARRTITSGYRPGAATNPRLAQSRNVPGWVTVALLACDAAAVVGVALA